MKCLNCSQKVPDGFKICPNCRTHVGETEPRQSKSQVINVGNYCQKCGKELPNNALVCPYCAAPTGYYPPPIVAPPKKKKSPLLIVVIVLGCFIAVYLVYSVIVGSLINNLSDKMHSQSVTYEYEATTRFDVSDFVVNYNSSSISKDYADKPVLIVKYDFTNNTNEPGSFMWKCDDTTFQNGVECPTAYGVDGVDSGDKSKEIQPGITYTVAIAYELQNTTDPVTLVVNKYLHDDETYFRSIIKLTP